MRCAYSIRNLQVDPLAFPLSQRTSESSVSHKRSQCAKERGRSAEECGFFKYSWMAQVTCQLPNSFMGEEGATSEVAETVENGTVSPDKAAKDVSEKKEAVEETEEDVKNDEAKEVDKEVPEVSKKAEVEESEVKDNKEGEEEKGNEEPKSDPMEVDDKKDPDEETENKNTEAADLKEEEENQEEGNQEEIPNEKESKKGAKKKGGEGKSNSKTKASVEKKEKEPTTPAAPTSERPVRERKSVERLVAVIEKDTTKEFHISKGRGTALKDIPNVAYKLSKRKANDDTLKLLHTILFGRRGKALQVKSNILQFSGFVWSENEEKHKLKVKEKLDKLNKEKLLEFCDIFDMTVSRANAKKEDIVVKLIDFMLTPHATTSELLAEKDQSTKGTKRKRESKKNSSTSEATPSKSSSKKQKTKSISEEDKKRAADTDDSEKESGEEEKDNEEQEDVNGAPEKSEDVASEEEHASEPESEEEDSSKKRKRGSAKSKSSKKESAVKPEKKKVAATPKKTGSSPQKKTPVKSSTSGSKVADKSDSGPKTFSRKNTKKDADEEKPVTPKKPAPKEKSGKKTVKEKVKPKSEKQKISDDDLRTAICEILKEVDFNTATFTDILKQLAERFNTDLTSRKASIKFMIQEELTKLADDEDEEEPEKTGKQASGQGVKA
ncbi:hypothetical protein L1987_55739 [Smallanthus sonchifolius]|uniref:Uncharacterized protein n=1 Tax=Smallanthus sonchifolius TaxID=185202 RepID=A0ACB9EAH9_9ASTR|nr:hypothetical protein L1987_55739 [Smallanthus sonchifolius]